VYLTDICLAAVSAADPTLLAAAAAAAATYGVDSGQATVTPMSVVFLQLRESY